MKFKNMSAVLLSDAMLISGVSICAADKPQDQKTTKQEKQSSFADKAKVVGAMGFGVLGYVVFNKAFDALFSFDDGIIGSHLHWKTCSYLYKGKYYAIGALIGLLTERSYHFYKKSLNAQVDLKNKDASFEELEDQKAKLEEERDKHINLLAKAQAALKTILAQQAQAEQAKESQEQSEVTPV